MQDYFGEVADLIRARLAPDEAFGASFEGEDSTFVRMNRGAIRQAGDVRQQSVRVDLIAGRRHAAGSLTLAGTSEVDGARIAALIGRLREMREAVPEDPHLLLPDAPRSTCDVAKSELPDPESALARVMDGAGQRDLVGIWASGTIARGFAASTGQRNWHEQASFNFDWSDYHALDKAAKAAYAGTRFEPDELDLRLDRTAGELAALARPPKTIPPGRYRVALAPAALHEIAGILAWGGFGEAAHRTRTSPLTKLADGEAELASSVRLVENTADGVAPRFQENGFLRPDRVVLVDRGQHAGCLVSPRSAMEYGIATNGATASEQPESLEMAGGDIPRDQLLAELGTGVYISNLWYMNYSDRNACRTTGMTRFATFWVQNGVIEAPLAVMRFDETLYRMFGSHLIGLSSEQDWILDPTTYGGRSHESARLPSALVDGFTFTL